MVYNTDNFEIQEQIAPGTMAEGVIIDIKDGKIKDFVEDTSKFRDAEQTVINVTVECTHDGQKQTDSKLFTYIEANGKMKVPAKSNLGKFYKYYENKMPQVGMKVQMKTNSDGFFKLLFQ